MSHVIKNREKMDKLHELFSEISGKVMSNEFLKKILEELIPRNEKNTPLTSYYINPFNCKGNFVPSTNSISLSPDYINNWVNMNKKDMERNFKIKTANNLEDYLKLFTIIHEIEHAYEYLMAIGYEETPNQLVKSIYKLIYSVLNPSPYPGEGEISNAEAYDAFTIYRNKPDTYLLERNANYETTTLLTDLAEENRDYIPYQVFRSLAYSLAKSGYRNDELGCSYHTFKDLGILDYYHAINRDKELDFRNNIRYGLEISPSEREELLKM